MLLILTSDKDFTADFLIVELINRDLPYFRLNAEELATAGFTFSLTCNTVQREISTGARALDLNEVRAVWYRRAIHPGPVAGLSHGERAFVAGELRHLAMGLVLNPDITWLIRSTASPSQSTKFTSCRSRARWAYACRARWSRETRPSCGALRPGTVPGRSASRFFMACSWMNRMRIPSIRAG